MLTDDSAIQTAVTTHRARRRPAISWPAALLPGALLLTLVSVGTIGSTSSDVPVTDLHVVVGPDE